MCGIALIVGEPDAGEATQTLFRRMLDVLAPRGDVEETWRAPGLLAGTQRLRIVDRDRAVQPWRSVDERYVLCYNGEVFNHHELRAELVAAGVALRSAGDTEVVLEAFRAWGPDGVRRLRGEFAFAIVDTTTGRTYLARDPLGVRPLYWACRDGRLHVASEVKALVAVGAPVHEVPPGQHGFADATGAVLSAYHALAQPDSAGEPDPSGRPGTAGVRAGFGVPHPASGPDPASGREAAGAVAEAAAVRLVRETVRDAIRVRVDTDLTVGVVLSGGVDSSVVLGTVRELHPDCVAFTLGAPGSEDLDYARRVARHFGVPHEVVQVRPRDLGLAAVQEAVRVGELTEYGDIINAAVCLPLFRRVREHGVKVVLTGDGSDELFGGYPMYQDVGEAQLRRLFLHKIRNLGRTELQRVDRTSMGSGVEARVPFLDPAVVELALRLPMALKVRHGQEKWVVRQAFADVLPDYVRDRPKNPLSYSTGLHDRVRLFKALFPGLHRRLGYDLHAPVRRDFDSVLQRCGNDLDRALADDAARADYTPAERARDLAGALRWTLAPGLRWR